ncbi:unnamed protein product [Triticum turgidum subsp. durum]|uniref:Chromatin-remodeling ATPase INO80 n=2 Tax=Triticum TaxID=4564 RepID=A0A9R0VXS3_TRITD|nr:unnamed protein product [Triticum turgidum subsp. durum]
MTKMLDILEDYMNFRKFKYFRLDGSSAISDRRDMVRNFQNRNDIFVFLLSTRAGGLGINLTAADTVIFYEIDWNPTQDQQAMDRTHRLGQTKEVTVYRLICKDTIEEKILQRAKQKNAVQELVMKGKQVQDDHLMRQEDVVSLLLDDTQIAHKLKEISMQKKSSHKKPPKSQDNDGADGDVPESGPVKNEEHIASLRPKRSKRLVRSTGEDKEPVAACDVEKPADAAENNDNNDAEELQDQTPSA